MKVRERYMHEPYPLNRIQEYRQKHPKPKGFKVLHLDLLDHPYLGSVQVEFVNPEEIQNGFYTSLVIGPNGSGKSYLLTAIINIFRQLKSYEDKENDKNFINGGFNIIFCNGGDFYSFGNIEYAAVNENNTISRVRRVDGKQNVLFKVNGLDADVEPQKIPTKILASSSMLWDKFPFLSVKDSFSTNYEYLGIRSSSNSAGTQDLLRKTVFTIVDNIYGKKLVPNLRELVKFLGYDESIKISFVPKYRSQFWNQGIDYDDFCKLFEDWKKTFPKRNTEPWGLKNFEKNRHRKQLISDMLIWMDRVEMKSYGRGGRYIEFDVLNDRTILITFEYIKLLTKLDLLHPPEISFSKNTVPLSLATSSSGERQIVTSLIGILAAMEDNSLVLIDEPEVSLHPNWQMKYMYILRKMFEHFDSSHFIISSHSHFLVSDSENTSSHVIGVDRETDIVPDDNNEDVSRIVSNMITVTAPSNTYGWSAEEILYEVFNVKTTRNHFLEYDLISLVDIVNRKSGKWSELEKILEKLNQLKISPADPLNILIEKGEKYLKTRDA